MKSTFVYWDNSNIFHEAGRLAERKESSSGARYRVRIHFDNLLRLAHADRPLKRALAAGSIPPDLEQLWNRLEGQGVEVHLYDRGSSNRSEQQVPDQWLQLRMLEDALDYSGDPGIVVLLTGDGAGYSGGRGFRTTLERMHRSGWGIEILSWEHSCNQRMREWGTENGVFVALDDFYESITFLEPFGRGHEIDLSSARDASSLDLTKRDIVEE